MGTASARVVTFVLPGVIRSTLFRSCFDFGNKGQVARKCRYQHSHLQMMATTRRRSEQELIKDVLTHWFGSTTVHRFDTLESQYPKWYKGSKEIDDDIRARFGEDVEIALEGGWDQLINTGEHPVTGPLALVILLDQYTRNIFRGSAKAYAGDDKCIQVASGMLAPNRWPQAKEQLSAPQLVSFLLPLMHQESLHHLDTCVEKISELIEESKAAGEEAAKVTNVLENNLGYAHRHRDIVMKFGRYPYRNDVLGRTCTPEELEFLENGPRFGQ